jgi:hypothetical protein
MAGLGLADSYHLPEIAAALKMYDSTQAQSLTKALGLTPTGSAPTPQADAAPSPAAAPPQTADAPPAPANDILGAYNRGEISTAERDAALAAQAPPPNAVPEQQPLSVAPIDPSSVPTPTATPTESSNDRAARASKESFYDFENNPVGS